MSNNINEAGIRFRRKVNPFTMVSNDLIDDERLSVQARFLYVLINRSITNDDWVFYKSNLQKKMGIKSENTFDKYWSELKKAGYLIQHKFKNDRGRWAYEYELMDSVEDFEPIKTKKKSPKNHTPNFEGVENSPSGKVGLYNKTNDNNTNLNNNNIYSSSRETPKDKTDYTVKTSLEEEVKGDMVDRIMVHCQKCNFKLQRKSAVKLLESYEPMQIIKAITTIHESKADVKKPASYIVAVLNDMSKSKQIIVEKKEPKSNFNNFQQREYDFDELEKKLLGWDSLEGK